MTRRTAITLATLFGALVLVYRSCILSKTDITSSNWKYADEEASLSEPAEFLLFRSGRMTLEHDTVFSGDVPIATLEYAYHKYEGTDRLFVKSLSSGRSVEYIDF